MPDPLFKTVSASQVPELLNLSKWGTRRTLHHSFKHQVPDDKNQTVRMKIGKLFEPIILEQTAEALTLQVEANENEEYVRHDSIRIGATRDAQVFCPTRGRGVVEAKAIDKYEFAKNWTENKVPQVYEVQLQAAMMATGDTWGVIACFVYNEGDDGVLYLYERRPNAKAQKRIAEEIEKFFADLDAGIDPPVFGLPCEMDMLNEEYPDTDEDAEPIQDPENFEMTETARMFRWLKEEENGAKRAHKELQAKIVDYLKDKPGAMLPGVTVTIKKIHMAGKVVMLPPKIRAGLKRALQCEGLYQNERDSIQAALDWCEVIKQPSVQNRITVSADGEGLEGVSTTPSTLEAG